MGTCVRDTIGSHGYSTLVFLGGQATRSCLSLHLASSHEICNFRHEAFEENGDEVDPAAKTPGPLWLSSAQLAQSANDELGRCTPASRQRDDRLDDSEVIGSGGRVLAGRRPWTAETFSLLNEGHFGAPRLEGAKRSAASASCGAA